MKVNIEALIETVTKNNGNVILTLVGKGKADTLNISAQQASLLGTLTLKTVIANKIALGSVITITVSDEKISE